MIIPAALADILVGRSYASSEQIHRISLHGIEHGQIVLPPEMLRPDGSLDVYPDVLKLFRPAYVNNRPIIQCTGWVGYIPLNNAYAIEIATRVPVHNLERLLGIATGYAPEALIKHSKKFGNSEENPESLIDLMADQLLDAFDHICAFGLLKTYHPIEKIGSSPVGRILPYQSKWRSAKARQTIAVSSSFHRTIDNPANRILRHALEKLLFRCLATQEDGQRKRTMRLRRALDRLKVVKSPSATDLLPSQIAQCAKMLPFGQPHYSDSLMVAQLIIHDVGVSIRGAGGVTILPSILIDMAKAFEDYIRRILAEKLSSDSSITVKDGNIGGRLGAKVELFEPIMPGIKNPRVTPDILIEVDGEPRLIIDAKYKPAPDVPVREDINQVILYGAKYKTTNLMLLHASRPAARLPIEHCGDVGSFKIYNGMIDLHSSDIAAEEAGFIECIKSLL